MDSEQVEGAVESETDWAEEQLEDWLKKKDWQVEELVDLLEGYEIPFSEVAEEPYLAILDALPPGGNRHTFETELARRAAVLLDQKPDEIPLGDPPERLLYNLLLLCAGLACPDQLADPLYAMWQRRSLHGEWQGLDLRYALSGALASNQLDSRMAPEWEAMLEGKPTEFLPGSDYDGFEAMLWMPKSKKTRGEPHLEAIGQALGVMADALASAKNRRSEFQALVRKVTETYPDFRNWNEEFIHLSDRFGFPGWAVECLPSLFVELRTLKDGSKIVLLWHLLLACLGEPGRGWVQRGSLCSGYVLEVKMTGILFSWIKAIAPLFEDLRKGFPFASERGLKGAVADSIAAIEELRSSKGLKTDASILRRARKGLLTDVNVGVFAPDVETVTETLEKSAESLGGDPARIRGELFEGRVIFLKTFWGKNPLSDVGFSNQAVENLPKWAAKTLRALD